MTRLLILMALFVVLVSAHALGSIPDRGQSEPTTECGKYLAELPTARMDQWVRTFQSGLIKHPELGPEVWQCVMDIYKMAETDQFMVRECRKNTDAPFNELAFKALSVHLDQCGIGVNRS